MDDRPPKRQTTDPGAPADELLLAALRRAVLHGPPHGRGAPLRELLDHLAIARRTARARAVAARLGELERAGAVTRSRVHGVAVWAPSPDAAARLAAADRAGRLPALPEAPQHRAWRLARGAAGEALERFVAELAGDLAAAEALLASLARGGDGLHSDAWLELGQRLLGDCRRLGSAWHCLHEWEEPDDRRADRDEPPSGSPGGLRALRAGRRNIALWRERVG